jgi:transposase
LAIESAPQAERRVEIELRRGAVSMTIAWPLSAACEMATWMRELLR